jgi:methionine synthase II (cobalamin-independent)
VPDAEEFHLVRERHRDSLRKYNDFRNHLEHIDDRLNKGVTDLGNLGGTTFSFDDKSFEVGEAQRREMEEIFNDITWAAKTVSARQSIESR